MVGQHWREADLLVLGAPGGEGKREALDHARMEKIPGWTLEACHLETCKVIPKEELRAVSPGDGPTRGARMGHAPVG